MPKPIAPTPEAHTPPRVRVPRIGLALAAILLALWATSLLAPGPLARAIGGAGQWVEVAFGLDVARGDGRRGDSE